MVINLDKRFSPFQDRKSIDFDHFTFSGGEPHIRIKTNLDHIKEVRITHRIQSFNDMGLLLVAVNALRNLGIQYISLFLPYFPGARQDRIMVKGEALTVQVYADLLNQLKLNAVTIFDPHSTISTKLIHHCTVLNNHTFIQAVLNRISSDILLISPDAGAAKRCIN